MPLDEVRAKAMGRKPDSLIELSVAELRELAESNANHPASAVYLKAIERRRVHNERVLETGIGALKTNELIVDREDILGILENKEVVATRVFEEDENGIKVPVIRKKLGDTVKPPEPEATEAPARKKEKPANP